MKETIILILVGALIIGLIALAAEQSEKDNQKFQAYIISERDRCLATKGETEFSCEGYINTIKATRAAEEAKQSADDAWMMSTVGMSMSIANTGSKR